MSAELAVIDGGSAQEKLLEAFAEGRKQGQQENRRRRIEHDWLIVEKAKELRKENPKITPDEITSEVQKWFLQKGLRPSKNPEHQYSHRKFEDVLRRAGFYPPRFRNGPPTSEEVSGP
jgi:hypothetical protein